MSKIHRKPETCGVKSDIMKAVNGNRAAIIFQKHCKNIAKTVREASYGREYKRKTCYENCGGFQNRAGTFDHASALECRRQTLWRNADAVGI